MKKWSIIYSLLLCVSCSESIPSSTKKNVSNIPNDTIQKKEIKITKPEPNTVVKLLTNQQRKKLSKYLKKSTLDQLDSLLSSYRTVQTDIQLEDLYAQSEPFVSQMEKEMRKQQDDAYLLMESLDFMDEIFAFRASCLAECTEFVLLFELKDFQKLAQLTSGNRDDEFFRLKQFACGDQAGFESYWLTFFTRTWDYGGGVELGDGRIFTFLKDSWQFQKKSGKFNQEIKQIRALAIENMGHRIYMKKESEVSSEIEKILKASILDSKEKTLVKAILQKNKDNNEEPAIQYDCANKECDWGG